MEAHDRQIMEIEEQMVVIDNASVHVLRVTYRENFDTQYFFDLTTLKLISSLMYFWASVWIPKSTYLAFGRENKMTIYDFHKKIKIVEFVTVIDKTTRCISSLASNRDGSVLVVAEGLNSDTNTPENQTFKVYFYLWEVGQLICNFDTLGSEIGKVLLGPHDGSLIVVPQQYFPLVHVFEKRLDFTQKKRIPLDK
jgi:hypothetical protein